MIISAALVAFGALAGWWSQRWYFVAATILVGLAISFSGWLTGWAASADTPAAGGAILLAAVIWIPLALGAALGVCLGQATHRCSRS